MTGHGLFPLDEIAPGTVRKVDIGGVQVAVVRIGDDVYAIGDTCTHADVSLSEGEVEGCTIECWLHGSRFDLRTGQPSGPPATTPVPVYPVSVEGETVFVSVA